MSDFSELWAQQMENPTMRRLMEETNDLIGRPQDGCKRLAEMDLTPEERERIYRILDDPRYPAAEDAIPKKVLGKTRWSRRLGALLVTKYIKAFQDLSKGE